jgi:hypothetical protein
MDCEDAIQEGEGNPETAAAAVPRPGADDMMRAILRLMSKDKCVLSCNESGVMRHRRHAMGLGMCWAWDLGPQCRLEKKHGMRECGQ